MPSNSSRPWPGKKWRGKAAHACVMVLAPRQPCDSRQAREGTLETKYPNLPPALVSVSLPTRPCWPRSQAATDTSNFPSKQNSL